MTTTTLTTSELWTRTHAALNAGRWSEARALLDDLGRRSDNHDMLSPVSTYAVPEHIRALIGDRIELVNSKV